MHSQDLEMALDNDEFLKMLLRAEKDPDLMQQMILVTTFECLSLTDGESVLFNMTLLLIILLLESKGSWKRVLELRRCRDKIVANILSFKVSSFALLTVVLI
jgi:hypothetical protein